MKEFSIWKVKKEIKVSASRKISCIVFRSLVCIGELVVQLSCGGLAWSQQRSRSAASPLVVAFSSFRPAGGVEPAQVLVPTGGASEAEARPGPPSLLQAGAQKPLSLFLYAPSTPAFTGHNYQEREGCLYGVQLEQFHRKVAGRTGVMAVRTGQLADVLPGRLLSWADRTSFSSQRAAMDSFHHFHPARVQEGLVRREVVQVALADGSIRAAFAYFHAHRVPLSTMRFGPAQKQTTHPVLLLHGLDSAKDTFADLAQELGARGLSGLAMDLRGSGHSPLGEEQDFSPLTLAADVRATARLHFSPPYLVLGHSCGARIALRLAAEYPDACGA
eukprot:g3175.t1